MYEKTIKFKLEKKFFNQAGFLDNKYVYEWMNLAKKYYLNGLGIDIDSLINYNLYYADIDVKYSIRSNIRYNSQDIFIKAWIEKNLINCENPRIHGKALIANRSGQWRYRVGDYRILAEIHDNKLVLILIDVGRRKDIYLF